MPEAKSAHEQKGKHPFSTDRPIDNARDDLLDRTKFAQSLAESIKGWRERDSLVLALHGPWGCGKTSIKNLVLESLGSDADKGLDVIEFAPWQWSSQSQIAEAFFRVYGETGSGLHFSHFYPFLLALLSQPSPDIKNPSPCRIYAEKKSVYRC